MPADDMDPVYSIGTKNRFAIDTNFDSDICDDPLELIRAAQEKPKKEKEVKPKGKKDAAKLAKGLKEKIVKADNQTETDSTENKRNDRPRSDRGGRGRGRGGRGRGGDGRGRGRGRGGFGGFNNASPGEQTGGFDNNNSGGFRGGFDNNNQTGFRGGFDKNQSPTDTQTDGFGSGFGDNDEGRSAGRSGFRGRGRGGGRGRGRGGNREFDRRSGSDKSSVKAVEKRDGSGSYNWGTPQDELAASEEQQAGGFGAPKEAEDVPTETVERTPETEEPTEPVEVVDEEPQEIVFSEWKKQQEETRNKPQFNIRKVENEKKGMKQLKKPTEEENEADGSLFFPKRILEEKYKSSGRVKEPLALDLKYSSGENRHLDTDRRRGGRDRGGRDNRKGQKEDGGFGSRKNKEKILLENQDEFPSL